MYIFIINPNARTGLGQRLWIQIENILKQRDVVYEAHFTKYQRHATKITKEITCDGKKHTIVVLGGDGTVNEVISGITDLSKVTLGYIPIGSSNDFARGLSLPTDIRAALDLILAPSGFKQMDVGILTAGDKQYRFAVSTGMGFDAAVCRQALVSRLKVILNKLKLGKLTYAGIALHQLFASKPQSFELIVDGHSMGTFERTYFAAIMNHAYEGGGFKFCPKANYHDGKLDIILAAGLSKLKVLLLLPTAFFGKHVRFKGVHIYSGKTVTIKTTRKLPIHKDGELVPAQTEFSASLEPLQLRVISSN